ncbi:MAG: stage II sporulation protein M, partial [Firmicutes bacterium]|nr:stage II sporulation protein M [Bacillota bacterium]
GVPATYAALAYKGAALGFSAAILLESLALRGVLTTVLAIVPSHLLILPALILASSAAINYVSSRRPGNRRKRSLSSIEPGPYCLAFLFPLILILIAAVLEAFISPAFLQLIKSQ